MPLQEAKECRFTKHAVKPLGDRILVKRRVVGEKLGEAGLIYAPQTTGAKATDLADVIAVPDFTAADITLLAAKERIIGRQAQKAAEGDSESLKALLNFNTYLSIKELKVGDCVMIKQYIGVTFNTSDNCQENLTIVDGNDIIAKVEVV